MHDECSDRYEGMNVRTQYGVWKARLDVQKDQVRFLILQRSRIAFKTEGMQCNAKPTSSVHGVQCSI